MKKSKNICILIIILIVVGIGILIYGFFVEPNRLVVKNESIVYENYQVEGKLKVVQFSDVHLMGEHNNRGYTIDEFAKLVDKINEQDADIVLFTGDLIDKIYMYDDLERVSFELSRINSKYGNYAVWGNHDYGGGGSRSYIEGVDYSKKTVYENIISQGGFKLLVNESVVVNTHVGDIVVSGLDDAVFGDIDYTNIYKGDELYHIVMAHEPDVYDEVSENNINLFVSGHSHGGQVRLPLIGAIIKGPYARNYVYGMYDRDETKLYVSGGVGTTHLTVRLLNPPSFTVFDIGN